MIGKGNDCLFPVYVKNEFNTYNRFRCRNCINCRLVQATEWSNRLEMEAHDWDDMCFVTLTYNNEHLPYVHVPVERQGGFFDDLSEKIFAYYPSNHKSDLSDFIKRLRKHYKRPLRYFGVCEYGSRFGRPHLHCLIFGLSATDRNAALIDRAWNYSGKQIGFVRVDPFYGKGTVKYVAGYCMKKLYGVDNTDDKKVKFRLRERSWQSQHLGENWFFRNLNSLNISSDHPWIDYEGYKIPIPATFRKKLVSKGILKAMPLDLLHEIQMLEYKDLGNDLKAKGISEPDFWKYRRQLALHKLANKTKTRNLNGDL